MRKFLGCLIVCFCMVPAFSFPTGKGPLVLFRKGKLVKPAELVNPDVISRAVAGSPVRAAAATNGVRQITIAGLSDASPVQFDLTNGPVSPNIPPIPEIPASETTVQLIPHGKVFGVLFFEYPYRGMFAPRGLGGGRKALYRGMKLANINEIKNLFLNGLQTGKVRMYSKEIFTAVDPIRALIHAVPDITVDADLPVLVRISFSQEIAEMVEWEDSQVVVFEKDIPAGSISDVWVLLNINGKPDWCKAVLQDDQVVLIPGYGKLYDLSSGSIHE